ncbi:hypothetical protein B0H21DRAFT_89865 [Amylocystis lapponica]|nr:hypothetical protein B0H21DRAFT_89865 [Amylocystis lapponica]
MTRTERAAFPRAVAKDHAESKTGGDKRIPKNGAGPHNWGSVNNQREIEDAAAVDEEHDFADAGVERLGSVDGAPVQRKNIISEHDIQAAREFRKNVLKNGDTDFDLSDIARTSAGRDVPITTDANASVLPVE